MQPLSFQVAYTFYAKNATEQQKVKINVYWI